MTLERVQRCAVWHPQASGAIRGTLVPIAVRRDGEGTDVTSVPDQHGFQRVSSNDLQAGAPVDAGRIGRSTPPQAFGRASERRAFAASILPLAAFLRAGAEILQVVDLRLMKPLHGLGLLLLFFLFAGGDLGLSLCFGGVGLGELCLLLGDDGLFPRHRLPAGKGGDDGEQDCCCGGER